MTSLSTLTDGPTSAEIRQLVSDGRPDLAWNRLRPRLLSGDSTLPWNLARNLLRVGADVGWKPPTARSARVALLSSYEGGELAQYLRTACLAFGIDADFYAAPYGQVEQEVFARDTGLASFGPTHVLVAPTTADLALPELSDEPEALLEAAENRWRTLWNVIRAELGARVVQHSFVVPDEAALGHLALRVPGSRISMVRELDRRLAAAAGTDVLLVDCERLAARIGKQRWLDSRLWFRARQPFSHEALPMLAAGTAAVIAGDLGLSARCLVLDLDNTLWGGVVGEDGVDGIVIGGGPDGEAYAAFQDYVRALHGRGIVLAAASKNDAEAARQPFELRREMRLSLSDFAVFVADWRRKPEQLMEISQALGLGLDALVFADDNLAECAEVAETLPDVTVVPLAVTPSELVSTLAACPRFELSALSSDDLGRQRSYAARVQAAGLRSRATSLDDFWRSLEMRARIQPIDSGTLARAAQLTQKTNQFNLTLRRRSEEELRGLLEQPGTHAVTMSLADRFADHGIIGVGIIVAAPEDSEVAEIDTLLLSCRVIGRTAEIHLLAHLMREARRSGYQRLRGHYVSGPRNQLVAELYPRLGFVSVAEGWEYDLATGLIESTHIRDEL